MGINDSELIFDCEQIVKEFNSLFREDSHLLIVVHDNPDPDAIASACALKLFVEEKYHIVASISYGGAIGRAENKTMISKLKIKMKQAARIKVSKYDRIALVDTQPRAGNHSLPAGRKCNIVIDHHPRRHDTKSEVTIVRPEIGATATILVELLKSCAIELPSVLATALSYAISSETQNMKREASRLDLDAYLWVYMKSNMRTLGEILHPKLHHSYFETLLVALKEARVFRNLVCIHLGEIPQPEIVAEMADYFLRHERIGWVFSTGRFKDDLIVSLRSSSAKKNAGTVIKKIVNDTVNVGGHDMIAGGFISVEKLRQEEISELEEKLSEKFAETMGYENAEWKNLMERVEDETALNDGKEREIS
jgi:nanoRNase/pAp phosphatase (c-di-AMP/oligoRNAs hydrolase)